MAAPLRLIFLQIRRQPADRLAVFCDRNFQHPCKLAFDALGLAPSEVALAAFGPHDLSGTGRLEPFGRGLVRFLFVFFGFPLKNAFDFAKFRIFEGLEKFRLF